ncbi:hypothetical protein GCM10020001_095260 [Nonomuraea salmonea]
MGDGAAGRAGFDQVGDDVAEDGGELESVPAEGGGDHDAALSAEEPVAVGG